jgi:hypothetical protein
MAVDYDRFLAWAESRFGDVVLKGEEIKVNSIFADDHKFHMWCNPSGGKKNRPNGVFHCWKTDKKGSLITLVMLVDGCSFEEAIEILGGHDTRLADLEKRVEEIFSGKKSTAPEPETAPELEEKKLRLPYSTYAFDDLPSSNYHRVQAEVYLFGRKLPIDDFMVCTSGKYRNRIIIPYYNRKGELIYWNSRYIGPSEKAIRYLGPDDDEGDELNPEGIGKGDVLYFPTWPEHGSNVYLAEGEFDGKSICVADLPGGAFGGKALTDVQIGLLRANNYTPILCLDSDKYGKIGLSKMGEQLLALGFSKIGFVRPPKQYKDWNLVLEKLGPKILRKYILDRTKFYGSSHGEVDGGWTALDLQFQNI